MEYAHPEVLVDTKWVEDHINDDNVLIAEVDYDPTAELCFRTYSRFRLA